MASNLVLLPGLDGTGQLFTAFLDALPKDIRAHVIGYPAQEPLDLAALAAMVLRQLPAEKPVLLAESFSGLVALTLLKETQARIRGVIFVSAFAEPPRPFLLRLAPIVSRSAALLRAAPSFLLRRYCLGQDATAKQLNQLREVLAQVSPAVLAQRLALVGGRHSFGKLTSDVPAWYIRASQDRLVPAACATWFEQRLSGCEMQEIKGPHFLLQARPQKSAEVIASAVRRAYGAR